MEWIADIKDAEIFIYVPSNPCMVHISKNLDDLTNFRTDRNLIYGVYNMQGVKRLFPLAEVDGKIIATYDVYYRFSKLEIVPKTLIFCYDADSYNYVYDKLLDLVYLSKYKNTMSIIKLYERSIKKDYVWVYHNNAMQKGEIITRVGPTYILKFENEKDFAIFWHKDIYFNFDEIINAYKNNKIKAAHNMDKKQKLIKEIEAAKKEFYAKNPCYHCHSGNGCDDCRDCTNAKIEHQLSKIVSDLEKKFEQEYGEDYDTFKENERNKKENPPKNIDLANLTFDELCKLRTDINEQISNLKKEDEEAKIQEFCKTIEIGTIYCEKTYNFYNDNTVYTVIKINGFEPNEKGKLYMQYTYYSITNKPDAFSIKSGKMNSPVEAIKHMTIFTNPIIKNAETVISEIETIYNQATTQHDIINMETFDKVSDLLCDYCKN